DFFSSIFRDSWEETVNELFSTELTHKGYPKVNISENGKETMIEAAVPGYSKDNLSVDYGNGRLTISGQNSNKSVSHSVKEIHQRRFNREFNIGDVENLQAKLENGILTVRYDKKDVRDVYTKIDIQI